MTPPRPGSARLALSLGAVVATAGLVTAAAITDSRDIDVVLDGDRNRFDLVVAASAEPGWQPGPAEWEQGRPRAVSIPVGPDGGLLGPGGTTHYSIAVRNDSPLLAGLVDLEVSDPVDRRGQTDPQTGRLVELFDQLRIVVRDGSTELIDRAPGTAPMVASLAQPLEQGEQRVLEVELSLPASLDDRWQGATTDLVFQFSGVNA